MVCICALLVQIPFLLTNTDYCFLLLWTVFISHSGTECTCLLAVGYTVDPAVCSSTTFLPFVVFPFITVFLNRFNTFLQCSVLVLKTISTAVQTQNYLNQTVQLYCKMKHCIFFL